MSSILSYFAFSWPLFGACSEPPTYKHESTRRSGQHLSAILDYSQEMQGESTGTSGRMLRLLSLLQARPNWTGPELASRLAVTPRTLRRDVTRLRQLGYPVEALSGPTGGYQLAPGGALPPLLLDDDEAVAVALSLRQAAGGGLPGFEDAALSSLAKISQVLPRRLAEKANSVHDSTIGLVVQRGSGRSVTPENLVILASACRAQERVRFDYLDAGGRASERHVEPHQLVHAARRWYLVARIGIGRPGARSTSIGSQNPPAPVSALCLRIPPTPPLRRRRLRRRGLSRPRARPLASFLRRGEADCLAHSWSYRTSTRGRPSADRRRRRRLDSRVISLRSDAASA